MINHETTLKNHGNQPKTMKNHETTLKNHGNQPKTMKMVGSVTDTGSQLTSFDPKMSLDRRRAPTDLLLIQKRHVTDAGPQLTSFD